ncbi:hypothetical protein OPQ81_000449 [Rhizoctonia solani]|nr:hypothetical protein OPQ81_000449 [Rhizoctonia solani]
MLFCPSTEGQRHILSECSPELGEEVLFGTLAGLKAVSKFIAELGIGRLEAVASIVDELGVQGKGFDPESLGIRGRRRSPHNSTGRPSQSDWVFGPPTTFGLSTPDQSPRLSSLSSANAVEQLFDPKDLSIDPSPFQLNPVPADVALPDSSSDASFDTVGYDLNDQLFSLQLGSTEYHFAREQLDLYEDLLHASGDDFRHLFPEDRLYLLSLNRIEYPSPPPSKARSNMATSTSNTAGNTNTIIIADKNYSIAKLQGQEDYQVWRICMEDMYQDAEVWDIVSGASTRPSTADEAAIWDKKNNAALGALRRRVEMGPMIHVARCTDVVDAWKILKNQYQSLGIAAMTMLRNKFTSLRMGEADDLESHIKELRKIFNDLNIALLAESSDSLKELEFIRQLLVSLPESWQILVSVIPQCPESNDTDGTKLSIDIQSRILAEYHRRKSLSVKKAFFARNRNVPGNSRGRNSTNPSNRIEIICHNCKTPGHKRPECRKPGRGAYKGNGRRNNNTCGHGNNRWNANNRNTNGNANNNRQNDNQNGEERVNYVTSKEFAFSFRFSDVSVPTQSRELIAKPYPEPPTFPNPSVSIRKQIADKFQHFLFSVQSLAQYGIAFDDAWIIDSGTSCHVTNRRKHLWNFVPTSMSIQGVGGMAHISGFGDIILCTYTTMPKIINKRPHYGQPDGCIIFTNVALVEDSPVNLLSLSAWTDHYPHHSMTVT